ncbi:MAG: flagellar basal body L-ring protein FlgH [Deltaproteobacteria bacterium]|nr:flagellar basal body L-ring protein FlgH [Deltaproteobacteria bacterium]MBW2019132.1 flagellar basal body L-ring protein FlgH [Deltaproteobacteria bacterium]MBW2073199.1 flagellar basal body L-ring protein FlgH [Deltaproteobacteria bacterium]
MVIRSNIFSIVCLAVIGMASLAGCTTMAGKASVQAPQAPGGDIQGSQLNTYALPEPSEGSLWVDSGNTKLFVDMRAMAVGDLVTVTISETPSAKLDANTKTSRDSSIEAGLTDLLGYMKALEEKNKKGIPGGSTSRFDRTSMFKANFKPSFSGKGSSDRSGTVVASITAQVYQVLPNGNLRISGKREIKVNNETQYITISGIIRPEDIDPANVIESTYIADARIEYSGKGVIADKQRPGWLMRILDHVWPF